MQLFILSVYFVSVQNLRYAGYFGAADFCYPSLYFLQCQTLQIISTDRGSHRHFPYSLESPRVQKIVLDLYMWAYLVIFSGRCFSILFLNSLLRSFLFQSLLRNQIQGLSPIRQQERLYEDSLILMLTTLDLSQRSDESLLRNSTIS